MGSSSIPKCFLSLSLAICLLIHLFPFGSAHPKEENLTISYHNGPLLTGNVSLAILWYGEFEAFEKFVVRTFIESLSMKKSISFQADVHSWWQKVHGYLELAEKKSPKGTVRIVREVDDENASFGHVLRNDSLPGLLEKATVGLANTVAVIFVSKKVRMVEACNDACYLHGVLGNVSFLQSLCFSLLHW